MSDAMQRLLQERWPRVRDEARVQLDWLRTAVTTNVDDVVGVSSDARKVAHQLRGRFGMYGRRDASEVAGMLEDRLLAAGSPEAGTGQILVEELHSLLDRLDALLAREATLSTTE